MIKTILIGVVCFVVALAASTSVTVMTTKVKPVAADTTAVADSTQRAASAPAPKTDGQFQAAGEFSADAPLSAPDLMQLAAAVPHQAEPVTGAGHAERPAPPQDYGRVGKILVNMKPAEAAAILQYLGDAQVEGVLRSMGPRQAAILLAAIPTERAAQLSKRLLVVAAEDNKP